MDKIAEKFNIFDIFTMMIPGIGISSLFYISLSFEYDYLWPNMGNEKYLFFLIFSYFCGLFYQELGTVCDKKFLFNILYKGSPREIFLMENSHDTILNDALFYNCALYVKEFIIDNFNIQIKSDMTEKELNLLIWGYCINMSEYLNIATKSQKMLILSEMSRSLFWGCISTMILNLIMIPICPTYSIFYFVEVLLLVFPSYIFIQRKKRYERLNFKNVLLNLLLYINIENKYTFQKLKGEVY